MIELEQVCGKAAAQLYDHLSVVRPTNDLSKLHNQIKEKYEVFFSETIPRYVASNLGSLLNISQVESIKNDASVVINENKRTVSTLGVRRVWSSVDESSLSTLPFNLNRNFSLIGITGGGQPVYSAPRPKKTSGFCVVEVALDWKVASQEPVVGSTFPIESVPEVAAISIRSPSSMRLHVNGSARIAGFVLELIKTFYSWIFETVGGVIRKSAVQLSTELYRRPRVLAKGIASSIAFACLSKGKDVVLFDDISLNGFMDVMEQSQFEAGMSPLKLTSILLGEVVKKDESAIAYVEDKRPGDYIIIDMDQTNAYANDEALRHAITVAWGTKFACFKIADLRGSIFVMFCPERNLKEAKEFVTENLDAMKGDIESSFNNIMKYMLVIEDLKLSRLFDSQVVTTLNGKAKAQQLLRKVGLIAGDKKVQSEASSFGLALLRKIIIGT